MNISAFFSLLVLHSARSVTPLPRNGVPGSPVIMVPGDGGSQFEAMLDKPKVVHIWCDRKTTNWFPMWLNLELLAPYVLDCFVDNMRLTYNRTTRQTNNSPGVDIRQPGFGNTTTVEWLDSSQLSPTSYYYHIAEALVAWGYTRNVNIRGVPYDFRRAPNEMASLMKDMKTLVEQTYELNNSSRVILMGHSMGCPVLLYFLNHQTQAWKDKYVKSLVTLAGPWGGAVKTMRLMASGDNLGVFVVNPLTARPEQRSMPSSAWLMPYDTFWNDTEVLISGPEGNYTVNDYKRFFTDISFPDGYQMRQDSEKLIYKLTPPGVEVHCIHGHNVKTPAAFNYTKKQWFDYQPDVVWGDGDGTVNLRSLVGCLRWQGKQKQKVYHKAFKNVDHLGMLNNLDINSYIKTIVFN